MNKKYNIEEFIKQANKQTHKLNKDEIIIDAKFQIEEMSKYIL
jgi:hypothetical protein